MRRSSICRLAGRASTRKSTKCRPLRLLRATCRVNRCLPISGRDLIPGCSRPAISAWTAAECLRIGLRLNVSTLVASPQHDGFKIRLCGPAQPHGPCARLCTHENPYRADFFTRARSRTIRRWRPRSAALSKVQYRPFSISAMPIRAASRKALILALASSSVSSAGRTPSPITSRAPLIAPLLHETLQDVARRYARLTWARATLLPEWSHRERSSDRHHAQAARPP